MKKYNKLSVIFSVLAIMLPVFIGLILWNKLPDEIPIHWNVAGEVDGYTGKPFFVFGFPLLILALHLICIFADKKVGVKNTGTSRSPKVEKLVLWICPAVLWFCCGLTYCTVLGKEYSINMVMSVFMGLLFCVIGNYMPKCPQSRTVGIKVKWALEDEENWNKTHRLAGVVWFISGLLIVVSGFLPQAVSVTVMFLIMTVAVIIPVVYSYLLSRKK